MSGLLSIKSLLLRHTKKKKNTSSLPSLQPTHSSIYGKRSSVLSTCYLFSNLWRVAFNIYFLDSFCISRAIVSQTKANKRLFFENISFHYVAAVIVCNRHTWWIVLQASGCIFFIQGIFTRSQLSFSYPESVSTRKRTFLLFKDKVRIAN